jgi:tripartite-type tricarboxylate transporter receptor subunit TctC
MIRRTRNLRSHLAAALAVAALACAAAAPAQTPSTGSGQGYPARPIEFVVHVTPGGGTDVFARLVTEIMTRDKLVTQPLVVLNRPGGAGVVAFTYIKSKRGDPHTVLTMATGSFLTAASRPDLDLGLEHYTPLAFFARDPQGIIVNTDSRYRHSRISSTTRRPGRARSCAR